MFCFEKYDNTDGVYIGMKDGIMAIDNYIFFSWKVQDKYFADSVMHRMEADREKSVLPPALMGTGYGISTFCLILIQLINAAHYDVFITSLGLLVLHEKNLTRVFTLRTSDTAVLIKLYDGCTLYRNGRKIYHYSVIGDTGDNHVMISTITQTVTQKITQSVN